MNREREWRIVVRAITLMARTKAQLVRLYADPRGGDTEPAGIVRQWSKGRIVEAMLDVEYPDYE